MFTEHVMQSLFDDENVNAADLINLSSALGRFLFRIREFYLTTSLRPTFVTYYQHFQCQNIEKC